MPGHNWVTARMNEERRPWGAQRRKADSLHMNPVAGPLQVTSPRSVPQFPPLVLQAAKVKAPGGDLCVPPPPALTLAVFSTRGVGCAPPRLPRSRRAASRAPRARRAVPKKSASGCRRRVTSLSSALAAVLYTSMAVATRARVSGLGSRVSGFVSPVGLPGHHAPSTLLLLPGTPGLPFLLSVSFPSPPLFRLFPAAQEVS